MQSKALLLFKLSISKDPKARSYVLKISLMKNVSLQVVYE